MKNSILNTTKCIVFVKYRQLSFITFSVCIHIHIYVYVYKIGIYI